MLEKKPKRYYNKTEIIMKDLNSKKLKLFKNDLAYFYSSGNLYKFFGEISDFLQSNWKFDNITVQLIDGTTQELKFFTSYGIEIDAPYYRKHVLKNIKLEKHRIETKVFDEQEFHMLDLTGMGNPDEITTNNKLSDKKYQIKQHVIFPLSENGHKIGLLHIFSLFENSELNLDKLNRIQYFLDTILKEICLYKKKAELEVENEKNSETINLLVKILSSINLKEILKLFGMELDKNAYIDGYAINLLDSNEENLVVEKISLPDEFRSIEKSYMKYQYPLNVVDANITSFKEKKDLFIDRPHINDYPESTKVRFERWKLDALVIIPIVNKNKAIGTLMVFTSINKESDKEIILKDKAFLKDMKELVNLFAPQISNAMFYTRLKTMEKEIVDIAEKNKKVLEIADKINNLTSEEQIYEIILYETLRLYGFDFGFIFMEKNDFLVYIKGHNLNKNLSNIFQALNQYFINHKGYKIEIADGATPTAFIKNTYFYFPDVDEIKHLPMSAKDKNGITIMGEPKSLLIMPIKKNKKPIGAFQFWSLNKTALIEEQDIENVNILSSFIGTAIQNSKLYSLVEQQKNEMQKKTDIIETKNNQLMQELVFARKIQQKLLPSKAPELFNTEIAFIYKPMEEVGGDFFDFIMLREPNLIGIFISDVSGHGVPAALITSMIKTLLNTSGSNKVSPADLLIYINNKIQGLTGGNFLTAFYGMYDVETKTLVYSRAAHNFPIIIRSGEIFPLEAKGQILGIMEKVYIEQEEVQLQSGDKVLFYTDGLSEAIDKNEVEFEDKLMEIVIEHQNLPVEDFVNKIFYELSEHTGKKNFEDDVCIIAMHIK